MKNSSILTFMTTSLLFCNFTSAIALASHPQKQTKQPIIGLPNLVEICRDYQPDTQSFEASEALAWLESQTSPITLTIFSAMWYGRNPDELEKTEIPISAIEACLSYPNTLNSELDTELNTSVENRTQALEYWQTIIPQPTFIEFYQMWQTPEQE